MFIKKINIYARLMRLDRPIGTLLLLWPTLWALWLSSGGLPSAATLMVFILGTVLMRSAGCVFNDIADRKIDLHVQRTSNRPFALGEVKTKEAVALGCLLIILAASLLIFLNGYAKALAVLAFLLAISYPYTKRFFKLPQLYLGLAFSIGILMVYAAVQNHLPVEAWILWLANCLWTLAYDTEYAMVDKEDDLKIGIYTAAITFDQHSIKVIMFCFLMFVLLMSIIGLIYRSGFWYWLSLIIVILSIRQQYLKLCTAERAMIFRSFLDNGYLGGIIFFGILFDTMHWKRFTFF